jgi:hypothetical protein
MAGAEGINTDGQRDHGLLCVDSVEILAADVAVGTATVLGEVAAQLQKVLPETASSIRRSGINSRRNQNVRSGVVYAW